jgi:hypothetical protein
MTHVNAWHMIQQRAAELGSKVKIGRQTFRAASTTAYLEASGALETPKLRSNWR